MTGPAVVFLPGIYYTVPETQRRTKAAWLLRCDCMFGGADVMERSGK